MPGTPTVPGTPGTQLKAGPSAWLVLSCLSALIVKASWMAVFGPEYLIARSCNRTSNWKDDTVLHMALCNPKSQPSLIEYLCRLNPAARYKLDEVTGALPIHLAYMNWQPEQYGIGNVRSQEKVLNLLHIKRKFFISLRRSESNLENRLISDSQALTLLGVHLSLSRCFPCTVNAIGLEIWKM